MEQLFEVIEETTGLAPEFQASIFGSLVIIVALWVFHHVLATLWLNRIQDAHLAYRLQKFIAYILTFLGLILVTRIWFEGIQSIATFLGLVSAGITIALREPVVNIAGWAFLMWRRPFNVGDRIQIGHHCGDVMDKRLFTFTMMEVGNWVHADQSTGRIITIPNGKIFTEALANYTQGFPLIWNELETTVTFESNWEKAQRLLLEVGKRHHLPLSPEAEQHLKESARRHLIFFESWKPRVYITITQQGVELSLRYLCHPRKRRDTSNRTWQDILRTFGAEPDIQLAYLAQRVYVSPQDQRNLSEMMSSGEQT